MDPEAVKSGLISHYEAAAQERESKGLVEFRADYRRRFSDALRRAGITELVDLGSGTGHEGRWFLDQGFAVAALDLSPAHVELCLAKGLDAVIGDFYALPWQDQRFSAAWCMSSIMHIPNADLDGVVDEFARILVAGGLMALGLWGGDDTEGIWEGDFSQPKRFYSLRSVPTMRIALERRFEVVDLDQLEVDNHSGWPYQWWLLRRRPMTDSTQARVTVDS